MEHIHWFGLKNGNEILCHSVNAEVCLLFIGKLQHKIVELDIMDGDQEISKLDTDLPHYFSSKSQDTIDKIYELSENNIISNLKIELENGGFIHFSYGQLHIKLIDQQVLLTTAKLILAINSYFIADEIIGFCLANAGMHYIPFVRGIYKEEITDQFDRMLAYTKMVERDW